MGCSPAAFGTAPSRKPRSFARMATARGRLTARLGRLVSTGRRPPPLAAHLATEFPAVFLFLWGSHHRPASGAAPEGLRELVVAPAGAAGRRTQRGVDWQMKVDDARCKLKGHRPLLSDAFPAPGRAVPAAAPRTPRCSSRCAPAPSPARCRSARSAAARERRPRAAQLRGCLGHRPALAASASRRLSPGCAGSCIVAIGGLWNDQTPCRELVDGRRVTERVR